MKKLLIFIKMSLVNSFEYRSDMLIYSLSYAAAPFVYLLVWVAVSQSSTTIGMTPNELSQYYLWLLVVQLWVSAWASPFISNAIRLGELSSFLVKPVSYFMFWTGNNLGEKILKTVFVIPIVAILVYAFHPTWPNLSILEWLIFFLSWTLAAVLYFLVDLFVGIVAFWIEESSAVDEAYNVLHSTFSGILIPLALMPQYLKDVSFVLPFRYEISFPLEIILNKLSMPDIFIGFGVQVLWVLGLYIIVKYLWSKGLTKYSASGN